MPRRNLSSRTPSARRSSTSERALVDLRARLLRVHDGALPSYEAVLVPGTEDRAVEAMLATFAPDGCRTLVVTNGARGARLLALLEADGKEPARLTHPDGADIEFDELEEVLEDELHVTHVAAVLVEPASGGPNDLGRLGALCREHGKGLLVDAAAGFGADEIRFDDWNLLALAAGSERRLGGAPGAGFVLARTDALDLGHSHAKRCELDLFALRRAPLDRADAEPFAALREALREREGDGGGDAR